MRDLWRIAQSRGAIEDIIRTVAQKQFWKDAWIAVNVIIRFDNEYYTEDELVGLNIVRIFLKPRTLEALVSTYVLSGQNPPWGLMDENDEILDSHDRINRKVKEIAASVYNDNPTFDLVLPELVSTYAHLTVRSFGQGLAEVSTELIELWKKILSAFEDVPEENRQINLLLGFLSSCSTINSGIYNCILDDMLNHDTLIKWLHLFQTVTKIDQKGIDRISKSLDLGKLEIEAFESCAYIGIDKRIDDDELALFLEKVIGKTSSFKTVFEILRIRFDGNNTNSPTEKLLKSSRTILTKYTFSDNKNYSILFDENISNIARICLTNNFSEDAKIICVNICLSISSHQIRSDELKSTLNFIFEEYPNEFLNIFLENDCSKDFSKSQVFSVPFQHQAAIIDIPDEIIENWGDMNPQSRYSNLLEVIPTFYKPNDYDNLKWRTFVYKLLRKDEYFEDILPKLAKSIRPGGVWSGTLEDNLQPKICLIEELLTHENEKIRIWASNQLLAVNKEIEWDFEFMKERFHQVDERFE